MNETEKDRILRMVSEGIIRPAEAAQLLTALAAEPSKPEPASDATKEGKEKAKNKPPLMEVQMQRPDGTHYTLQVPPNLFPMFWQMAKVAIKESARSAAQDTWAGLKHMAREKTAEVKNNVRAKVGGKHAPAETAAPPDSRSEARRQILQMVQNGRITADDAGRLIQQMDALQEYQDKQKAAAR